MQHLPRTAGPSRGLVVPPPYCSGASRARPPWPQLTQPSQSSGPPGADSSIAPLPGSVHYSDPDNLATQAHFSSSRPPERKEPKCAPPHMHS